MNTRKVLISPGFGSGWSTWLYTDNPAAREMMLFDSALTEAVEQGRNLGSEDDPSTPIGDFVVRFRAAFPDEYKPYIGGNIHDLEVVEVSGQFRIDEYDGFESIVLRNNDEGWL